MDFDYVLKEMRNGCGTQLDPQFVDILLGLIESGKINLNDLYPPREEQPPEPNSAPAAGAKPEIAKGGPA